MKKITLLFTALLLVISLFAQQEMGKQDYLEKARKQRTIGKIFLGAGGAMALIAIFVMVDDAGGLFDPGDKQNYPLAEAMTIAGLGCAVAGIPLLIASGKNNRKALSLSISNQPTRQVQQRSLVSTPVPSLSLRISL